MSATIKMKKIIVLSIIFIATALVNLPSATAQDMTTAIQLYNSGKLEEAKQVLEQLYQKDPGNSRVVQLLKNCYSNLGQQDRYEKFLWELIQKNPQDFRNYAELAQLQIRQNKISQARATLQRSIDKTPSDPKAYWEAARVFQTSGLPQEAKEIYLLARKKLGKPHLFAMELADIYESQNDVASVIKEYFNAVAEDSFKVMEVEAKLEFLLENNILPEDVEQTLSQVIRKDPKNCLANRIYGDLLFKKENYNGALEAYKMVDKFCHTPGKTLLYFAKICLDGGAYVWAERTCEFILINPNATKSTLKETYLLLAKSRTFLEKYEAAEKSYQKLLDLAENEQEKGTAYLHLGDLYFDHLNNFPNALQIYQKILTDCPRSNLIPEASIKIADCFLARGERDSAFVFYQKLLNSNFGFIKSEELNFKLAEVYFYQQNFDSALAYYNKVIADFPKGVYVNDALEKTILINTVGADSPQLDLYSRALFLSVQRKYADALQELDKLNNGKNSTIADRAIYDKALIYQRQKEWDSALKNLNILVSNFPQSFYAPLSLKMNGDIYFSVLKEDEKAREAYQKILDNYPKALFLDEVRQKLKILAQKKTKTS